MKSKAYKQALHTKRVVNHASNRKQRANKPISGGGRAQWLGDQRPVMQPRSWDTLLLKLERDQKIKPQLHAFEDGIYKLLSAA